ncbi:MAG TPA: NADH-quinone oxidoreductase subunit N [Vicinamibacterales bacterium]|jgi:NADH-quinone oxidoreductase subunit N
MVSTSIAAIVPILCVTAAGIAAMLAEAFREPHERMPISGLGLVGLVGAGISCVLLWGRNATSFGVVSADNFGLFISLVLVLIGVVTMLLAPQLVERDELPGGEFYALSLFALAGMMLMAMATDLLVIFLALEVLSLAVYVLTAIRREAAASVEGAFKYFILGGFSSAFFLYGLAFVYGVTGSTRLDKVGSAIASNAGSHPELVLVALGFLIVGFGFKVSAVPFHMWTPDAYEGAPAIVTGFMSTGVKAAAFAAFVRVFVTAFQPVQATWTPILWAVASVTMILGTVVGVAQVNLKRMLAYSSIAHAGYILVGLVSGNDVGKSAILFYLLAYGITNLGAFGVIALLGTRDRANDDLDSVTGLSDRHPALAAVLAVLLLSLGGIPPTAGFVGKWYIFSAAVRAGDYGLAIIGVVTSVVSIFFYLRVIVMMYMAEPAEMHGGPATAPSRAAVFALAATIAATFYLGVLPTQVIDLAARSIGSLR